MTETLEKRGAARNAPPRKPTTESRRRQTRAEATINLRVSVATRDLIDSAAEASGKSRTEFVLDSARQRAIDVLLDQKVFRLDEEAMQAFLHVLDNPPAPNAALKELMNSKAPWQG
jgi:uncharacterized protein (DUF1778 family)